LVLLAVGGTQGQDAKTQYPAMPEAFSSFGAAVCEGQVYVYGGHIGKTHTYSTEAVTGKFRRLNLSNPKGWEELPGGPAIQGLAMVAHGGKLYRIGGMQPRNKPTSASDNHSLATCAVFDPAVGKWAPLPDLPAGRSSHDATVVGNRIYVLGGWQMNGRGKKSIWHQTGAVLDLSQKTLRWEAIKQPFQRRALNVAALEGKVYVVGGMGPDGTDKSVDVFDPATQRWSKGPALPGPSRNGFTPAVCASAGTLFASPTDGKLYRLDLKKNAWDEVGSLAKKRVVHRLVAANDGWLLVLGGGSRDGNLSMVETIAAGQKQ
jgi:N-acetylneuraminic acid mutarotase